MPILAIAIAQSIFVCRNDPISNADADGHIDDNADPDHPQIALPNGDIVTLTRTSTTTFNADGSAEVTDKYSITAITHTDPNTGLTSTQQYNTPAPQLTQTHEIDRARDNGRITVDGKVAPRSWGDNIKDVARTSPLLRAPKAA